MSNLFQIRCPQDVSDEAFTEALEALVFERFGSNVGVNYLDARYPSSWSIGLVKPVRGSKHAFSLYRAPKRADAFNGKIGLTGFSGWLNYYVRNQVAARLEAVIVDIEDTGEEWEPEPERYPDYESWIHKRTVESYDRLAKHMNPFRAALWRGMGEGYKKTLMEATPDELLNL